MKAVSTEESIIAMELHLSGNVQGVGTRPLVYRLAGVHGVLGHVQNDLAGVAIEVEGKTDRVQAFLNALYDRQDIDGSVTLCRKIAPRGYSSFRVLASNDTGPTEASIPVDLATCKTCLAEVLTPTDRRFRYPFICCASCGPRASTIDGLPYDRERSTMREFELCNTCRAEYDDPKNRRFHAQGICCPDCGPQVALWNLEGKTIGRQHDPLRHCAELLRDGKIVAVKGIGGFHLLVDATNEKAVQRLRQRKKRASKPFAVIFASLAELQRYCETDSLEIELLTAAQAPIVLVSRRPATDLAASVAPGNPLVGAMLSYSALHYLLLTAVDRPLVATSGNLSGEPLCTNEQEALQRLAGICDAFLVHNRRIVQPLDDSILRVMAGRPSLLRAGRGYAPLVLETRNSLAPTIAFGAHVKNAIGVSRESDVVLQPHIGDLDSRQAVEQLERAVGNALQQNNCTPTIVAHDLHPSYASSRAARKFLKENEACRDKMIQHHYAHVLSCMCDNEYEGPVLGICWDGMGLGSDGTLWGGEFLQVSQGFFSRFAHFHPFVLLSGEEGIRDPKRSAISLLYETFGESVLADTSLLPVRKFSPNERQVFSRLLESRRPSQLTSSAGRLFDAVAALVGVCSENSFEGQAAMSLEFLSAELSTNEYSVTLQNGRDGTCIVDWREMIKLLVVDLQNSIPAHIIASRFHRWLAEVAVEIAGRSNERHVVLSGGCFQNKLLLEQCISLLRAADFEVLWHRRVPPNDGGIAVGQILAANRDEERSEKCV